MEPKEVLKQYYGYDDFRPLQAEIIASVLSGRDTLALMPTGGGKSLCFQVPTLALNCLCLVVTPLIALMRDQVDNLRQRDIRAAAIYTGMTYDEQRVALDNCQFGPYRFLYVSPERLESKDFRERLKELPIRLIAVDEAHCISQWGYDFRPSYLRIAEIREQLPGVPIIALTATATPEVVEDIQEKLGFRERNVFRLSFHRDNLQYIVRRTENKLEQIVHILSRVPGSSIVYVRNRKRAEELSAEINTHLGEHFSDFYHAGLTTAERREKQEAWKSSQTCMVCTNAFGMGIDKPDVRMVIHHDLPDTLEAYYQEAGRGGRDGRVSYAVLLYSPKDRTKAQKRILDNYPPKDFVEDVYHKCCDYLQIGEGSGLGHTFSLKIEDLCRVMHLPMLQCYSALQLLTQAGHIHFEDAHETSPRVRINVAPQQLQSYALSREQRELLDTLMRRYTGIFTDLQYIDDAEHDLLVSLAQRGIITYVPRTVACAVTMVQERQGEVYISPRVWDERQQHYRDRLMAMVEYAEQTQFCREQVLLAYFGEADAEVCTHCDVCRSH